MTYLSLRKSSTRISAAANKYEDITVPDITVHLLVNYAN